MRRFEISIHGELGENIKQASLKVDVPDKTDRKVGEDLAISLMNVMVKIWLEYKVTASLAVVDETRTLISYGDVKCG